MTLIACHFVPDEERKVMQYDGVHEKLRTYAQASDRVYRYNCARRRRGEVFKASAPGPQVEAQTAAGRVGFEVVARRQLSRSGKSQ